jgi:hypothetical protein
MKKNQIAIMLLANIAIIVPVFGQTPTGVVGPYQDRYYKRVDTRCSWNEARVAALNTPSLKIGGKTYRPTLATMNSFGENSFVFSSLNKPTNHWLGGYRRAVTGQVNQWAWVTGRKIEWNNWAPGEPNGSGANMIFSANSALWDDRSGTVDGGYIVEFVRE